MRITGADFYFGKQQGFVTGDSEKIGLQFHLSDSAHEDELASVRALEGARVAQAAAAGEVAVEEDCCQAKGWANRDV